MMEIGINIQWNWEDMCGPMGLQPWDEDTKDIGQCFQQLFFQAPLYFLIAIVSGYYIGYRNDWVIRERTQERAVVIRSFVVFALAVIPIIDMYVMITKAKFELYPINYFVEGASCLSWLVHFGYVLALKHRLGASARGPLLPLILWSMAVVLNILALRSNTISGTSVVFNTITMCCHALYFLTLIPSSDSRPTFYSPCLVGSQHNHSEYTPLLPHVDEGVLGTAMQSVNWFSKLTFSWVDPLLQKGLANKLNDLEELYDIPAKYSCYYVGARMDRALIGNVDNYQQFEDVPHEPFISTGYGSTGVSSTPVTPTARVLVRPLRRQNVSLLRALHSCFSVQFYSIGLLKLVADMTGFAGPLLLNKLVSFVGDSTIDMHYGYIYSGSLLIATLVSAFFNVQFNWLMSIIGLKMRGALVYTILGKTLSVTSTELTKSFTVGEITNFMSTDTDRIINSCPSFHALWSIPLQLFITLFLLYQQVGISFLAGVAFSVLLIPINKMIANKIGQLSTELMKHKDSRVNLISDLLRGIRTVKVHVWEDYFINRVSESRSSELRYLRGRKYLDAVCVVLWATTPVLVAALTLGTHALRRQPLLAPTVFTTVALINMLIAPLNAFPWVLNGLTEAWVSIKRIQKLLDLQDMDAKNYYDRVNRNHDEDKVIILSNASFTWAKPSVRKTSEAPTKKNKGKSKRRVSKILSRNAQPSPDDAVTSDKPFELTDINLEICREQLIGVTGTVGSGKTSLLHAVIGEMIKKSGDIQIPENLSGFGYVSQKPWLTRGTIRDNILFGKPYDEAKFHAVVEACALTEDLNVLGWGAFVGEGGCTLSGGQRARIALARAVYQDKQVYLLDDVLSGVDARVAHHIMQKCILGLLKRTTRIMVTHSHTLLARTNYSVLLYDGKILKQGFPEVILNDFEEYLPSDDHESSGEEPKLLSESQRDDADNVSTTSLDNEEAMSQGTVAWWVVGLYLRSVGFFLSIAILLSLVLMQLSQNFTFLWLTYWLKNRTSNSTNVEEMPFIDNIHENKTILDHSFNAIDNAIHNMINTSMALIHNLVEHSNGTKQEVSITNTQEQVLVLQANGTPVYDDNYYLEIYFGLAGLNLLFTMMRAFLFAYGGVSAAAKIHKNLLKVIVRAKVKFFDVTPAGRILNRFSSDTYTVDDSLPFILNILLAQIFSLVGAVVVTVYGLPWLLVAVLPITVIYYWLQRRYRITSRQLKRLQSVTLSPIYAHFNDTLEGLTTVRAFRSEERWRDVGSDAVSSWQRATLCASGASCWLSLRLQGIASCVVAGAAGVAVLQRSLHAADPGLVGLAISYALSMTSMLSGVLNSFTETEREMIAVERVGEYIRQVVSEKIDGDPPPYGWPSQGVVSFENVSLKYSDRESGPLAVNNVSWTSHPAERVGVAGRTGSGKSSLLHAILRTAPLAHGRVTVDTVDLASLHLHALRSRIGMIPQEPFIFSGSVRENVDPLRQYSEGEVWRALERAGAAGALRGAGAGAGAGLQADATRLSRGTHQLLALARALLQRPKVLLVDEATANLDQETERLILDSIRSSFAGCTVVLVAHRVVGVLECSRVLVMGKGEVLEFDSPDSLLSDPTSQLYSLVHAYDQ